MEGPLVIRNLLDDVLQFCLSMEVAPHEIFASADQLQVLEFIERVKIERFNGLTYSHFHNSL
jgi:hypothetical protein